MYANQTFDMVGGIIMVIGGSSVYFLSIYHTNRKHRNHTKNLKKMGQDN